jgi:hypothetical protein
MRTLLAFIFVFALAFVHAQEYDSTYTEKKIKFNGLYLGGGLLMTPSVKMSKSKLDNSWSGFKDQSYYTYNESDYSASGYTGNSYFEFGASFYTNFGKVDSLFNRWQLHVGICYMSQSTISSFDNYVYKRIDTLAPTSGAANFYMDHVEYNAVYVTHNTDLLGINISEMYSPYTTERFFSLTGGFGLNAMIGVSSDIHESTGTWTVNFVTDNTYYDYNKERPNIQVNAPISASDKFYASNSFYSFYDVYLAGGANLKWITGRGGSCVILNPVIKAGVKSFNISKGGSYTDFFALPQLNLRLMFK